MSENPAADDGPGLTPPPPPELPHRKWMPLGVAAVAVMLLGIAVLVWQP